MSAPPPLVAVWDALERGGCEPKGEPYDFYAQCPVHRGARNLHVAEGADRRVVLHCHAHGCSVREIVSALGLTMTDLFPPGHHRSRRRSPKATRRSDFHGAASIVANVLLALQGREQPWRIEIKLDECPYCGSPHPNLMLSSDGYPSLRCEEGCNWRMLVGALCVDLLLGAEQ